MSTTSHITLQAVGGMGTFENEFVSKMHGNDPGLRITLARKEISHIEGKQPQWEWAAPRHTGTGCRILPPTLGRKPTRGKHTRLLTTFSSSSMTKICLAKSAEDYKEFTLGELLPESFGPDNLN